MKIMLVDDSRTMRNIQRNCLKQMGYDSFVEAGDGQEAMTVFDAESPDLILLDWNMPNVNGLQFLQHLRAKDKKTPVMMVTTEAEKRQVINALQCGANNYIIKPFSPELLQEKVRQTLEKAGVS